MTRFLHITDLHLEADAPGGTVAVLDRLMATLPHLDPAPEFVVATGDLTDRGDAESYQMLKDRLAALGLPLVQTLGNHDLRAGWHAEFPGHDAAPDGPVDQEAVLAGVHIIALDSSVPGKVSGALNAGQLSWLEAALDRHPDLPKLIALHHPPQIDPNMPFTWEALDEASTQALGAALAGRGVVAVLCGHVHRNRVTLWQGIPVVVTMGLQSSIDVTRSDSLRVMEGCGFAICDLLPVGFQVSFAPLEERAELQHISAESARNFD